MVTQCHGTGVGRYTEGLHRTVDKGLQASSTRDYERAECKVIEGANK